MRRAHQTYPIGTRCARRTLPPDKIYKSIPLIPRSLHTTALAGAEAIINRALQYDPATRRRLGKVAGCSMSVEVTNPSITVNLVCHGEQFSLHDELDKEPDVSLKSSASALIGIALQKDETIAGSGVEVRGSLDTLQQLKNILSDLDVDWEAALAELVGELPAHLMAKAARSAHYWQQQARPRALAVAANFVQEEARLTPTRAEVDQFRAQVRKLSADTERLAARINRLTMQLQQQTDQ